MGTDGRLYSRVWQQLPDSVCLNWPEYRGEKTIEAIARRMVEENQIPDGSVIIGTSLGGMVGCEIARLRSLRALVLVSSAVHPEEVNRFFCKSHPTIDWIPIQLLQTLAGAVPMAVPQMFHHGHPSFIRAMCHAIFRWKGLEKNLITPLRIHGTGDFLIPLPKSVDKTIRGGHLIVRSHAQECVDFICSRL